MVHSGLIQVWGIKIKPNSQIFANDGAVAYTRAGCVDSKLRYTQNLLSIGGKAIRYMLGFGVHDVVLVCSYL